MERTQARTWAVSTALIAVLLSALAVGLGADEAVLFVGLAAAPIVMAVVYRQLRRRAQP